MDLQVEHGPLLRLAEKWKMYRDEKVLMERQMDIVRQAMLEIKPPGDRVFVGGLLIENRQITVVSGGIKT